MEHYLSLFVRAIFIENMALSFPRHVHLPRGIQEDRHCGRSGVAVIVVIDHSAREQPDLSEPARRRRAGLGGSAGRGSEFFESA